ncbi:MAG: hypothetical protein ACE149_07420 [Armatimonadota bacterium]
MDAPAARVAGPGSGAPRPRLPDAAVLVALSLSAAALWGLCWAFAHTDRTLAMRPRMLALFFTAFMVFLAATFVAVRARKRLAARLIWPIVILGIALRLAVAPVRPATTSDIYRYVWEGRVVLAGMNPYSSPPDSPHLRPLRDWVWTVLPWKSVPAAYPPVAQYVFAGTGLVPGNPIINLKLIFALFDIGTVLLLLSLLGRLTLPRTWIIIYAWHPLAICEVVARGHFDSLGVFLMVLAARLLGRSWAPSPKDSGSVSAALSGVALAASILAKGYALVIAPLIFVVAAPRRVVFIVSLAAAAALAYLPFASAGLDVFRGASMYAHQWQGNSSIFQLLNLALSPIATNHAAIARAVCLCATVAWLALLVRRSLVVPSAASLPRLALLAMAGFFLLSPPVYPWYLAWTLPWLCLSPSVPWLILTGTVFGFYAHDFAGHHQEIWWVTVAEYGLPLLVAPLAAIHSRRQPPCLAAEGPADRPVSRDSHHS